MIVDKIGTEIKIGNVIAYGHALGRCAGLRIGKVLKLKEEDNKNWSGEINPYQPKIYRIIVLGIDDDWSSQKLSLCAKKGCLQFPNRIIVLDEAKLPTEYKNLLDTIKLEIK